MKKSYLTILVLSLLIQIGCTVQFIPETDEDKELLVVEGMITDQNRKYTIKLSKSLPLGKPIVAKPVKGAKVTVTDEKGAVFNFIEIQSGKYVSDSTKFRGRVGGIYTMFIRINNLTYTSQAMEMKPSPPMDSVYYERVLLAEPNYLGLKEEGCQIYVDTYDPSMRCLYYRWDFTAYQKLPWLEGLQLFLNVNNITDRSDRQFRSVLEKLSDVQYYGLTADVGVRYSF